MDTALAVFAALTALWALAVFGTNPERRNPREPRNRRWHVRPPR